MPTVSEHIRRRLLTRAGVIKPKRVSIAELRKTEWSPEFEQLMRNRMVMGSLRYGRLGCPDKPQFDRVSSVKKRLELYEETGNTEHLVDCANLCLLEFVEGHHPTKHFSSLDDADHHTEIKQESRS